MNLTLDVDLDQFEGRLKETLTGTLESLPTPEDKLAHLTALTGHIEKWRTDITDMICDQTMLQIDGPVLIGRLQDLLKMLSTHYRGLKLTYTCQATTLNSTIPSAAPLCPEVSIFDVIGDVKIKEDVSDHSHQWIDKEGRILVLTNPTNCLVLENLTRCIVIVPSEVRSVTSKNLRQCHIWMQSIASSFLLYGSEDTIINLNECSQIRIHDSNNLSLAMASDKKPIFESCARVRILPPIVESFVAGDEYHLVDSGAWHRGDDFKAIEPIDFSSQYLADPKSITWCLNEYVDMQTVKVYYSEADSLCDLPLPPNLPDGQVLDRLIRPHVPMGTTLKEGCLDNSNDLLIASDLEEF